MDLSEKIIELIKEPIYSTTHVGLRRFLGFRKLKRHQTTRMSELLWYEMV